MICYKKDIHFDIEIEQIVGVGQSTLPGANDYMWSTFIDTENMVYDQHTRPHAAVLNKKLLLHATASPNTLYVNLMLYFLS